VAKIKKEKEYLLQQAFYCSVNSRGEFVEMDKSFQRLFAKRLKNESVLKLLSIFKPKEPLSLSKIIKTLPERKIINQRGFLKISDTNLVLCEAIYLSIEHTKNIKVVFQTIEDTDRLMKEIEALNSIADHNLEKLIKANEKLESARKAE